MHIILCTVNSEHGVSGNPERDILRIVISIHRLLRIEIKTGPGQTGPARQARDILRSRAPCTKADDLWSLVAI